MQRSSIVFIIFRLKSQAKFNIENLDHVVSATRSQLNQIIGDWTISWTSWTTKWSKTKPFDSSVVRLTKKHPRLKQSISESKWNNTTFDWA